MKSNNENLGIWTLGVALARRVRIPVKLGMLTLLLWLPLVAYTALLMLHQANELRVSRAEVEGLNVLAPLFRVVPLVQEHRSQTNMLHSGNTAVQAKLDETRTQLMQAQSAAQSAIKSAENLNVNAQWQALAERLQTLAAASQSADAPASFKLHSELVRDLRYFVLQVGESSGLLYEADPATYLLIDMVISHTLPWTELLGQIRETGADLLTKPESDAASDAAMHVRMTELTEALADMHYRREVLKRNGETGLGLQAAIEAGDRFATVAAQAFASGSPVRDPQAYFAAGTRAIDLAVTTQAAINDRLAAKLKQRSSLLALELDALALGSALGCLILLYLLVTLYKSFTIDLNRLNYVANQIAEGNLRVVCGVRANDEIGDLAELIKRMITNVSAMVAAVGSDAALVAHVGRNLSAGNHDLSDRTEQQAANLEQTSASVHELASTVQQNAQTASDVNRQAIKVRDIAESGARSVATAIESVEAIQASAHRMGEIIGVIDGLAFQTNILALNAAVEAARAGEQGRGFAVVATEVRTLAQRSAASAREIRTLIQSSSSLVEASVAQIRVAGEGMTHIVSGIRTVAGGIAKISTASDEQSTGLSEISSAVTQLDQITQQNAQMVGLAVAQSDGLETQAASLTNAIGIFKLQQGVAGEAMALVGRAVEYRERSDSREAYVRGLTDPANNFYDRDMYVFALDRHGAYLAFGGNLSKVGSRVQDIAGIDGQGLFEAIVAQAEREPGWVEYDITNPASGKVQTKMSFVQCVDDLYVGCGVYKSLANS